MKTAEFIQKHRNVDGERRFCMFEMVKMFNYSTEISLGTLTRPQTQKKSAENQKSQADYTLSQSNQNCVMKIFQSQAALNIRTETMPVNNYLENSESEILPHCPYNPYIDSLIDICFN